MHSSLLFLQFTFYFTNEYWMAKPPLAWNFSEQAKERGDSCLLVPQCSYGPDYWSIGLSYHRPFFVGKHTTYATISAFCTVWAIVCSCYFTRCSAQLFGCLLFVWLRTINVHMIMMIMMTIMTKHVIRTSQIRRPNNMFTHSVLWRS